MSRPTFNVVTGWDDSGRKTSELMIIETWLLTQDDMYVLDGDGRARRRSVYE